MADDDRDKLVRKHATPPLGTPHRAHTEVGRREASPPKKTPTAIAVPRTISDSEILDVVERRTGETKNLAIDTRIAATTTLDRVEGLRREHREDIARVHTHINRVDSKVDSAIVVIGELREDVAEQKGVNRLILEHLEDQKRHRENTQQVVTRTRLAEIEVDTTRAMTELELSKAHGLDQLEAAKERRKNLWALAWKIVAGVGALWAVVSVSVLSKC